MSVLEDLTVNEANLLRQIDLVKKYSAEKVETLPEHVYNAMNGLARSFLAYKDSKGRPGWSRRVVDEYGEAVWSPEQASLLEKAGPNLFKLLSGEVAEEVAPVAASALIGGGALDPPSLRLTPESTAVRPDMTGVTVSLDAIVDSISNKLAELDEKNREIASTIGPVAFINKLEMDPFVGPFPPYLPARIQIPARAILPSINALMEAVRLLSSEMAFDVGFLRQLSSIVLGVFDILRGEWRDGVLSFMGVISSNWMIYGMIGKTVRWVYNFISPDIQSRLAADVYASFKSMFVGAWFWLFSVVSPDFVRGRLNEIFEANKAAVDELNKKIDLVEAEARKTAADANMRVIINFPRVPLDRLPSLDDIQNIQALLHHPAVLCSPATKTLLAPAMDIPVLRVLLELLNIPTLPEDIQEACKDVGNPIDEGVKALAPTVVPLNSTAAKRQSVIARNRNRKAANAQQKTSAVTATAASTATPRNSLFNRMRNRKSNTLSALTSKGTSLLSSATAKGTDLLKSAKERGTGLLSSTKETASSGLKTLGKSDFVADILKADEPEKKSWNPFATKKKPTLTQRLKKTVAQGIKASPLKNAMGIPNKPPEEPKKGLFGAFTRKNKTSAKV